MKLKHCPLCKRRAHAIQPIPGKGRAWNIACGTGNARDNPDDEFGCGLVLHGGDGIPRAEMVRMWNTRAGEQQ